jgi:hypothetical protein
MCYDSWKNVIFTLFACSEDEQQKQMLFNKVFPLYRHSEDIDKYDTLKNMLTYDYSDLTIKSIHYWARENPKYDAMFPEIKKEWEQRPNIKQWKIFMFKASKIKEDNFLGIDTIHLLKTLHDKSNTQPLNLQTIKNIVKHVIVSVSLGGNNPYFVRD